MKARQYITMLGLALAAVLALSAAAAGSASALPEFLVCMETASGLYASQAACEELKSTSGKWEWEAPLAGEEILIDFISALAGLLETALHHIECTKDAGEDKVLTASTVSEVLVKFTGCKELPSGKACHSTSPLGGAEEIITNDLAGELVYLKAAKMTPVGLLLKPEGTAPFVTITCVEGPVSETVIGSIIGEVMSPINVDALLGIILYNIVAGKQEWTKVEEGATKFELTAFMAEPAVLETEVDFELLRGSPTPVPIEFQIDA